MSEEKTFNVKEAGLKLASSARSKSKQGDVFLDRTIYHTVELTDADGRVIVDRSGNPIVENRAYLTIGRWITEDMMERAMEVEKEFAELNKMMRDDMDRKKEPWRISKSDIRSLDIQGVI